MLRMSSPPLCVVCVYAFVWWAGPESFPWQPDTWHHRVWVGFFHTDYSRRGRDLPLLLWEPSEKNGQMKKRLLRCFFFLVIFITEVRMSIGLWFDSEGFCCIREKQTDRHSQTCWHSQRDSAGTQYGRETGPTPYSTVHCLLTLTQMNPSIQKEIQKHTHTLLPPVVPLPPGISESSCAVVVNQSFLLIDLSA